MTSKIDEETIQKIIIEIESKKRTFTEITKEYNITAYLYYKIMKDYNLKPDVMKRGPKGPTGPKNTKLTELLHGPKKVQLLPESFNIDDFISDTKNGIKIDQLMKKYNITLYQIRDLRKKYDLKRQ